jgi:SHS2 domain-containing protein
MPVPASYTLVGQGSDLVIEVAGPTVVACLDAVLRGFAAALLGGADPASGLATAGTTRPVRVEGRDPPALLLGLVDEAILRLDTDGELVTGLADAEVGTEGLVGHVRTAALDAVAVHGAAPKAATWHGLRLEPDDGGWSGQVMLDL